MRIVDLAGVRAAGATGELITAQAVEYGQKEEDKTAKCITPGVNTSPTYKHLSKPL